tara:strand:+ start:150 stop:1097 length:948 start_codon:yes stop_codon:yes gene_type:complete
MNIENVERFFYWINERHAIYQKRVIGLPRAEWTNDPILQEYKFTNPFRENDRVTMWMRNNWTKPNDNKSHAEIIFNCCLFRMVGTIEFAEEHSWVNFSAGWDPEKTKDLIKNRIAEGKRTFTGAYIITNQGLKLPKADVVVDHFLKPIYKYAGEIASTASTSNSLKATHKKLSEHRGWGGGGFMSYEVITDLNYTPVLRDAVDKFTWANAGPGAKRGLNRIWDKPLTKSMNQQVANEGMQELLEMGTPDSRYTLYTCSCNGYLVGDHVPADQIDMRTIEHSLCEWDKYERVRLGQGRPRSKFKQSSEPLPQGVVK